MTPREDDTPRTWVIDLAQITTYLGHVSFESWGVDVGGETDVPVTFSAYGVTDASELALTAMNYDSGIAEPIGTVTMGADGDGTLVIKGTGAGSTPITLQDMIGDECTQTMYGVAPMVGGVGGTVTQGVTNDSIGFDFSLYIPSVTDVVVDYNTMGSTLPSSLLGPLSGGSVTIPAADDPDSEVFVPFNVADDGKVAPTRYAVVNLVVPNDLNPPAGELPVVNNDKPTITLPPTVTVDPQGDSGDLAAVGLGVTYDGVLNTSTFGWAPSQDVIWPTDNVGAAGTDLAHATGTWSYGYLDYHTWPGQPPADLYAQAIGGSSSVDGTSMTLGVDVTMPATAIVGEEEATRGNTADTTQHGLVIDVSASGMVSGDGDPGISGEILVGAGVYVSADWEGPAPVSGGDTSITEYGWSIEGAPGSASTALAIAGYDPGAALPATPSGSEPQVSLLTAGDLSMSEVHYYYLPSTPMARVSSISLDAWVDGEVFNTSTQVRVWTPAFTPDAADVVFPTAVDVAPVNKNPTTVWKIEGNSNMMFGGTVKTSNLFAPTVGSWHYTQIFTSLIDDKTLSDGTTNFSPDDVKPPTKNGLDNQFVYGGSIDFNYNSRTSAPADGTTGLYFYDLPSATFAPEGSPLAGIPSETSVTVAWHAITYVMYNPGTGDSIDVALQTRKWTEDAFAQPNSWSNLSKVPPKLGPWMPATGEPTWERIVTNY